MSAKADNKVLKLFMGAKVQKKFDIPKIRDFFYGFKPVFGTVFAGG
jgi:hypothetical protein